MRHANKFRAIIAQRSAMRTRIRAFPGALRTAPFGIVPAGRSIVFLGLLVLSPILWDKPVHKLKPAIQTSSFFSRLARGDQFLTSRADGASRDAGFAGVMSAGRLSSMPVNARTLIGAAMLLLGGCSNETAYSGDGRLIDNGVTAADFRYVIEIGSVDLGRKGSTRFKMAGLPRTYFAVGLQVPGGVDRGSAGNAVTPADVSLEITQENYGMVALITAPLRDWTWLNPKPGEPTFVYLRRSSGSYFDAFTEARYRLDVVVNVPDPSIPAGSLVVLKSAGWK